jgi:PST family polysaccharide transporter
LNSLFKSKIFQVFYSTGFTTGLKILATVVLSKIVAVKLGPPGLAMLGQLTSFITIALLLSTGGFGNGIIKYVAELKDFTSLNSFVGQSFKLTIIIAGITALILFVASNGLSILCFNDPSYHFVFKLLGITIILYAASNYFTSFLNGMANYKTFNWFNALNSIFSLIVSVVLIQFYGLKGAFLAVALNQTISGLIAIYFAKSYLSYFKGFWKLSIKSRWIKKLFSYSLMALITALLVPTSQLFIRKLLINNYGTSKAGEWEAINRISSLYLSILINIMLVYYLPKLSSLQSKSEIKVEIKKGFQFFLPVVLLLAGGLFLFRDLIIHLFLSSNFTEIRTLFLPQLIGDVFKILSFLYAYLVIAKSLTFYFILTEIISTLLYLILVKSSAFNQGVIGVVYAYMVTYITYFVLQFFFIGKIYLSENTNTNSFFWKGRRL